MSLFAARLLVKRADHVAESRGHMLGMWQWQGSDAHMRGEAYCIFCKMAAMIDTHPAPNSIDIGGEAVALNCPGARS